VTPGGTVAKSARVQREGSREVTREVEYFNLDVIISVGYRVSLTAARSSASGRHSGSASTSRASRSTKSLMATLHKDSILERVGLEVRLGSVQRFVSI
jgi:hypothetical protein